MASSMEVNVGSVMQPLMNANASSSGLTRGPINGPTPFMQRLIPREMRHIKRVYDPTKRHSEQTKVPNFPPIPQTFLDAMSVRETVYVDEQHVPLENEFDNDDQRATHFVIYASVQKLVAHEVRDPTTDAILIPRQSVTRTLPIGTIRLVPFPHPPHPRAGGAYVGDVLTNAGSPASDLDPGTPRTVAPLSRAEASRVVTPFVWPPQYERATDLHDGQEPYLKLGRLAVLKEFRGRGIASQLIRSAINFAAVDADIWDPMASNIGFERVELTPSGGQLLPRWNGLFCCHAQETAVPIWEKHGFKVDRSLGRWTEEGIPHVAMFLRVPVAKKG
ncbi:acyl-CoA N-acyltransferase [Cercophora newfieldiana]|uniref:Acyl-CoA N-acyltransferase n=1 Tax=Cercophora newfieldiana TaxID=92897 RepID=A0AA39XT30_9PEZI|nr:acyl-CoA N-acyltransferase [Cercophora newfieldiana]